MLILKNIKTPIILYTILLLGAVHSGYGSDHRQKSALSGVFPEKTFALWNSKQLQNNIYEEALLNTGKIDKRVYFNNHDFLWYVLVESLHGHHGQHQPEVCYTGNGWSVEKRDRIVVHRDDNPIKATKLLLHRKSEYRWVVYWYSNGNMTTGNFYERVFQHVWDDWSDRPYSAWTFHRVSMPVIEDIEQSMRTIRSFIKEIEFNRIGERV